MHDAALVCNRHRGPQGGRRALREQRLHHPLHRDGRRAPHRRGQRARAVAGVVPDARRPHRRGDPWTLGPHPGDPGDSRRRVRGGGHRRGLLDAAQLRLHPRGRVGHRGGAPADPDDPQPGSHARIDELPRRGNPPAVHGDTLFPGGPGAPGFEGGDFEKIIRSIEDRMFSKFDGDTIVLPGHGDDTTIGNEVPHLQEWIDRGW